MTTFRVSGTREVLGQQPGAEFDADLDEITEQRLTGGGHIERATRKHKDKDTGAGDDAGTTTDETKE